jgi:medium-chain acyl-[acyl-carrier-protein] hydrolase
MASTCEDVGNWHLMSTPSHSDMSVERWIAQLRPAPNARLRLVCFPYAGGGIAQFQPWGALLPPDIDLCAIKLPGRESRLQEPPSEHLLDLATTLGTVLVPLLDRDVVFFGHSLGALVGFETIRALRRSGYPIPRHFFASGRAAPQVAPVDSPIHHLPQAELIAEVTRRYDGIPRVVLEEPSLLNLLLPMLRGDLKMLETYQYHPEAPLQCPITAFGGESDPRVALPGLHAWASQTDGTFNVETFRGGHFYLQTERPALLSALVDQLHFNDGSG